MRLSAAPLPAGVSMPWGFTMDIPARSHPSMISVAAPTASSSISTVLAFSCINRAASASCWMDVSLDGMWWDYVCLTSE